MQKNKLRKEKRVKEQDGIGNKGGENKEKRGMEEIREKKKWRRDTGGEK
jgi:hypothetical protein